MAKLFNFIAVLAAVFVAIIQYAQAKKINPEVMQDIDSQLGTVMANINLFATSTLDYAKKIPIPVYVTIALILIAINLTDRYYKRRVPVYYIDYDEYTGNRLEESTLYAISYIREMQRTKNYLELLYLRDPRKQPALTHKGYGFVKHIRTTVGHIVLLDTSADRTTIHKTLAAEKQKAEEEAIKAAKEAAEKAAKEAAERAKAAAELAAIETEKLTKAAIEAQVITTPEKQSQPAKTQPNNDIDLFG